MSGHKVFRVYIAVSVKCARWAVGAGVGGGGGGLVGGGLIVISVQLGIDSSS